MSDESLPQVLEEKFARFRFDLISRSLREWVCVGFCALIVGLLVFAIFDRFVMIPFWIRLLFSLVGWMGFLIAGPILYRKRVVRYSSREKLATLLVKTYPRFGDRLLGVLELRHQSESFSQQLSAAALAKVAEQSCDIEFKKALPVTWAKRCALVLLIILPILTIASVLQPKLAKNVVTRYALPLSEVPRFTFIRFATLPDTLTVAKGEPFPLTVLLKRADLLPEIPQASARVLGGESQRARYDNGYQFEFQGVDRASEIVLQAGDAVAKIKIMPVARPRIQRVDAVVKLPDYLEHPEERVELSTGVVGLIEGATGRIYLETTSELSRVDVTQAGEPYALFFDAENSQAVSETISRPDESTSVQLILEDQFGIRSANPRTIKIQPREDLTPVPSLKAKQREYILLSHESITVQLSAKDDYGIKEIGLLWKAEGSSNPQEVGVQRVKSGAPTESSISSEFLFQPTTLGILPQSLDLYTYSLDYFPDRERALSPAIKVHILSPDQHAALIRERLDELLDTLESGYDDELNLSDENKRLSRLTPEQLSQLKNESRLRESLLNERAQQKSISEAVTQSQEMFQDTLRNDSISRETKTQLAKLTQRLKELSETSYPDVTEPLGESLDRRYTMARAKRQLNQAIEAQDDLLEKMQKAISDGRAADQQFEAATFVQRIEQLAKKEARVSAQLLDKIGDLGGVISEKLDPRDQREVSKLRDNQLEINSEFSWVLEDLKHYYTRSQGEQTRELIEKIESSPLQKEMADLVVKIQKNHRFFGAQVALNASERLKRWASNLSGEQDEVKQNSGSGGSGSQNGGVSDEDAEFMLRVMEIVKKQQNLRGRTRAIEQMKRHNETATQ